MRMKLLSLILMSIAVTVNASVLTSYLNSVLTETNLTTVTEDPTVLTETNLTTVTEDPTVLTETNILLQDYTSMELPNTLLHGQLFTEVITDRTEITQMQLTLTQLINTDLSNIEFSDVLTDRISTDNIDWGYARLVASSLHALTHSSKSPMFSRLPKNMLRQEIIDLVNTPTFEWWDNQLQNPPILARKKLYPEIPFYRIVADLRVPQDYYEYQNQLAEIDYFKSQGYNTLLVTYLGETEKTQLDFLRKTLEYAKAEGWRMVTGPSLRWRHNLYIDPAIYRQAYELIVPYCDFTLSGWRDLSNGRHWRKYEDNRYNDLTVLLSFIREVNPEIPIIGETWFYGADDPVHYKPDYIDGILLGNIGHIVQGTRPKPEGFWKWCGKPDNLFVVITGGKPHYSTRQEGWMQANQEKAMRLEQMFKESGKYAGSITLIGASNMQKDNMCKSNYHEIFK